MAALEAAIQRSARVGLDGQVKPAMTNSGMKTSRAALDRLLDADNTSVTLATMAKAAATLGKELSISLRDAA